MRIASESESNAGTRNPDGLPESLDAKVRLQYEVEQFLYEEAALLDERRFAEWLDLLTDDIHYWMPIRRTTTAKDTENEFTEIGQMAFFDDDKELLTARVRKMAVGYAWSEDPPSRTRHFVTNVRLIAMHGDDITVEANFHLYRTRLESEEDGWRGRRQDVLRRVGSQFRLAKRHIYLEQTVLLSPNLSNIF